MHGSGDMAAPIPFRLRKLLSAAFKFSRTSEAVLNALEENPIQTMKSTGRISSWVRLAMREETTQRLPG
jgi:hypothetical protein